MDFVFGFFCGIAVVYAAIKSLGWWEDRRALDAYKRNNPPG
jgi:hypothetical protein